MQTLLITNTSPWPVHTGGSQRTNLICRALQELGRVDVVVTYSGGQENTNGLQEHFPGTSILVGRAPGQRWPFQLVYRYRRDLANKAALVLLPKKLEYQPDAQVSASIRRLLARKKYDLLVGRYLRPTMKSGCFGWDGPIILDLDDVDSHIYQNRLNDPSVPSWQRWINKKHARDVEGLERELLPRFDAVWVANPRLSGLEYLQNTVLLPNISFPNETKPASVLPEPSAEAPPAIVFVGVMDYCANISAVDYFIRAIWPAIRRAKPRARFRIAGGRMLEENRKRWGAVEGVEILGFVPDIATAYADSHFAIAPILYGSGTNIKVLECFAYGRTCVASAFAADPFADIFRDGVSLRVGGTDEAFAAACVDLLQDAPQRLSLAARGRELLEQHFSFTAFKSVVADTVSRVLERSVRH